MREGVSKPVVIIPSAAEAFEPQPDTDRPLWVLNHAGRGLIESRPTRDWDGETISLVRFKVA